MKTAALITLMGLAASSAASAQVPPKVEQACADDYKSFCSLTIPGGGRIARCLMENKITSACRNALLEEKARRDAAK